MPAARINILAVACLLGISAAVALPSSRILEGEDVASAQYPFVVSVRVKNAHAAVGTLISDRHVLTVAHPVSQLGATPIAANTVSVRAGSVNQFAGGIVVAVEKITIHPSYGNFLHNVAILTLAQPLTPTDKIAKIDYAGAEDEIADNTAVTVSGWGLQISGASPYKLQEAEMTVLSPQDCEYQAGYGYASVLCLNRPVKQGVCRGDEGGPVFENNKLVGVVSFPFGDCGTKFPDIASRTSYYHAWIESVVNPQ